MAGTGGYAPAEAFAGDGEMKTELDSIEESLEELRRKKMSIHADNFRLKITPLLEASIGEAFVYRDNSHGGDQKWDTFRKLRAVVFSKYHAWAIFEECSIQGDGNAVLETRAELVPQDSKKLPFLERGWKKCSRQEYADRREAVLNELACPLLLKADLENR